MQGIAHIFIKQEDPFMLTNAILPITFGAFGMIAALLIYVNIIKSPAGEGRVKEISDEIHLGAMVFMASEYKRLAIFCLICISLFMPASVLTRQSPSRSARFALA
jgi:Na+/H+-translocating membrane pyrophosphatase